MVFFAIDWTQSWHARISYAHIKKKKREQRTLKMLFSLHIYVYICEHQPTRTIENEKLEKTYWNGLEAQQSYDMIAINPEKEMKWLIFHRSQTNNEKRTNAFDHVKYLHPIWSSANKAFLSSLLRFCSQSRQVLVVTRWMLMISFSQRKWVSNVRDHFASVINSIARLSTYAIFSGQAIRRPSIQG